MTPIKGGGGTSFAPAFEYLNEHHDIDAAVYLTDLCSDDFGEEPNYPVLWVSTTDRDAPWGSICRIQMEEMKQVAYLS
jgi:predicted metal-dependent peptidase